MNISEKDLQREIEWAILQGWIAYYQSAAATYGLGVFDVADYMAITSRETNFDPRYLKVPGDGGHGYGPMQADNRSAENQVFIKSGEWKHPDKSIIMGARCLAAAFQEVKSHEGQKLRLATVKNPKKFYVLTAAKRLTPNERHMVALAAYNCGLWSLYHISKGRSIDFGTTGKDYSGDVSQRAIAIRMILAQHEAQSLTRKP